MSWTTEFLNNEPFKGVSKIGQQSQSGWRRNRTRRSVGPVIATRMLVGVVCLIAPTSAADSQAGAPRLPIVPDASVGGALAFPLGLALGSDGAVYVSERRGQRVRRVNLSTGHVSIVAGTGEPGFSGDGGAARQAQLRCPDSITLDTVGNLYIADRCNERIQRVDARTGIITTVAGNGARGPSPDGSALSRALMGPYYVRIESDSTLLFADTDANRIRRLNVRTQQITTLAGSGARAFDGDGGPALRASFARPHVALRARNGDLIIGDNFNQRIRRVSASSGVVRTIAGRGVVGGREDPRATRFGSMAGLLVDSEGCLIVVDAAQGLVRRIDLDHSAAEVVG